MTRPGKGVGAPATVTQVRTWVYDNNQRLYSVVHPESGTTAKPSVRYNYNPDGSVQWKMDAKDQKTVYTYDTDGRVSVVQRYLTGGTEDTCAKVEYFYNSQTFDATFSQNATGRLAATTTGCTTSGAGKLIEMYSYNAAGAVVKKRLRIVRGSGTVDKDVAYTYGTDGKLATVLHPGTTVPYTYSYDLMDRPNKMTGPPTLLGTTTADLVKDVNFGVAGQVTSMKYMQWQDNGAVNYFTENRTYNSLFQLTRQETVGATAAADIEYSYTASGSTLNDGRIVSRKNNMRNGASGETVTYNYDELNRVTQASSSVGWAQSFDYDGFGNMWTASMAGGTATPFNATYSQTTSTNRIATAGWGYDDNGNTTAMPVTGGYASLAYDVDNRLKTWTGPAGTEEYGYLADNKRVWKKSPAGVETIYFYGVGGQKLLTYTLQTSPLALVAASENVYFGGKLIRADGQTVVHDRLGSVVARGDLSSSSVTKHDYLPYGEEMGTPTSGNVDKFGTYLRDQATGLDYADQRYFAGTLSGRFLTADPYEASGGTSSPGSWGRYAYVGGDPINYLDPLGLQDTKEGIWQCMLSQPANLSYREMYERCSGGGAPNGGGGAGSPSGQDGSKGGKVGQGKNEGVKGVAKAKDALNTEKCRKALGVDSVAAGASLVDSVDIQAGNLGVAVAAQTVGADGILQWELSYRVASTTAKIITLNSSVFDRPDALVGGSPYSVAWSVSRELGLDSTISNEDFQALFLLHELAHVQNTIPSDTFVNASGEIAEDWAKSMANTRHIFENCFKK